MSGSLINDLMTSGTDGAPEPVVGMGVTILMWSDRHPGTIVKVTKSQIHVQGDKATRTDKNGMSEMQIYTFEPNPEAGISIFRKTKKGWKNNRGEKLAIGYRDKYHDYSF